jgi:signal transduction histidine kinase
MASVTVGACLLLGLMTSFHFRSVALKQANDSIVSLASLTAHNISPALNAGTEGSVRDAISGLFAISGVRFVLVQRPDGGTFVSMGETPPRGLATAASDHPYVQRISDFLVATAPVRQADNEVIGTLSIGYSMSVIRHVLVSNLLSLLAVTLALALISVLIGHTLGRRLTTPLLELTESTRKLAAGLFEEPLPVRSNDEVGLLASTFNTMTARLAATKTEIERSRQMLEGKVAERTEELRQKNRALKMQNEQVLEANRLKGTFLANVSHELRTPLNAILALSELLTAGLAGELNEEQRSHCEMIYRSGTGLLRLINDILDLSKIEAGRLEIVPIPCNVIEEIRQATIEMQPMAVARGIDLRIAVVDGPTVLVDSDRVRQIFVNLLGNAIKFTERGYVEVSASIDCSGNLLVNVRDTGIGIARHQTESIFQEFRQLDSSPSRRFGGTGLGLSISRRLAELMGGEIEVESAVGRGSLFRVRIPVAFVDITRNEGDRRTAA